MKYYHGEVKTGDVFAFASDLALEVNRLGGQLSVGLGNNDAPAILMIELPDSVTTHPSDLFQSTGVTFEEVRRTQAPAVEDHGLLD